jgi:hypothetical protein
MVNQHIPVTGGCLCGAVRYESREPPTEGYYCHCTMCRRHYGGIFAAAVRFPGGRPQVHEEPAQILLFERLGQARLLLRLRFTSGVLLRGGSRCLDQRRIPRPSRGLADDEARFVGTIHACVYRHEDPMVRDQRWSSTAQIGRAVRGGQGLRCQNFAMTLV